MRTVYEVAYKIRTTQKVKQKIEELRKRTINSE
jgi:hypothetical protein